MFVSTYIAYEKNRFTSKCIKSKNTTKHSYSTFSSPDDSFINVRWEIMNNKKTNQMSIIMDKINVNKMKPRKTNILYNYI